MSKNFITLVEYRTQFPERKTPTLTEELLEILKYRIGRENATFIIKKLGELRFFRFPAYLDQLMAISLLTVGAIPETAEFTVEFWDSLDSFCASLVQFFSTDDGKRMRPSGPTGTTLGNLSATNPLAWEQAPRKRGGRRKTQY
ncbi:MAG: hypothetical protein AAB612_03245 [Patescibacteria group bacterium]